MTGVSTPATSSPIQRRPTAVPCAPTRSCPQTDPGTPAPTAGEVLGTKYQGPTAGPFDGSPSGGEIGLDLDWALDDGEWEFIGRFTAQKNGSPNSISGQISGIVFEESGVVRIEASMLVDTATGAWSGWSGDGFMEEPPASRW